MKPRVVLIGGFTKTRFLALSLIAKGYKVIAINRDQEKCRKLAEIDHLTVFHGDGSKPFILEEANIYDADIAIALTNRDDDNFVICELCKKKFNVKKTVAIVSDPQKTDFFYHMNIDVVISAAITVAAAIEQLTFVDELSSMISFGDSSLRVMRPLIPSDSPLINHRIDSLSLPKEVIIACLQRHQDIIVCKGDTTLQANDRLLVIVSNEDDAKALNRLFKNE